MLSEDEKLFKNSTSSLKKEQKILTINMRTELKLFFFHFPHNHFLFIRKYTFPRYVQCDVLNYGQET